MLKDILQNFDLNDKESRAYLACLELGETNIQRIAAKSKVNRTTLYEILESLKAKGLISLIRKNKKIHYYAESPLLIKEKLKEKENLLDNALPELLSIANYIDKKPKVRYFEGAEGIKEVFLDNLNYPNQRVKSWVADVAFYKFDKDFLNYYIKRRIKANIWVDVIAVNDPEVKKYKNLDETSLRKTILLDREKLPLKSQIDLYGKNKIRFMSYEEGFALIIESKPIFQSLEAIFDFMWKTIS